LVEKRFVDNSGNEIIISVDDDDLDFDIEDGSIPFDITIEEGEEPTGDLVISCKYLNVRFGEVYPAIITIEDGKFKDVIPIISDDDSQLDLDYDGVLIPGFIDSHIHIESSKLSPSNFAKAVLPHGTTSVIADSHEIANVLGIDGVNFMVEDGKNAPFDFYFTAPSCVPATSFEGSGATLDSEDIEELLKRDEMVALGEMMNFKGVIGEDEEVIRKLEISNGLSKPIDGHAPRLSGDDLKKYASYNISTDHESTDFQEAIEKKNLGMKIMIREGSTAKDMDSLLNVDDRINHVIEEEMKGNIEVSTIDESISESPFDFLVTNDIDANDLSNGHMDNLVKKAISLKINPKEAIKMVTLNPAEHYGLNCGEIEIDKVANFALVDNLRDLNVQKVWVHGELVAEDGKTLFTPQSPNLVNNFNLDEVSPEDFDTFIELPFNDMMDQTVNVNVIKAFDGKISTKKDHATLLLKDNIVQCDLNKDIIKIAVLNRYGTGDICNGFINGFNLKKGAIASTVSHDSHNVIVVGTNSQDMADAVNLIRENKGGIAVVSGEDDFKDILELPIAGLMSDRDLEYVSYKLTELQQEAHHLGCTLTSPFMTLSFMALLVIPSFKISDKGLFDVNKFKFIDLLSDNLFNSF
jgi:adenine deaminase